MIKLCLLPILLLMSFPLLAQEEVLWLPHVTPLGSVYQTEIVLTNHVANPGQVIFQVVNPSSGRLVWVQRVMLAGYEQKIIDPPESTSYLAFARSLSSIDIEARYSSSNLIAPYFVKPNANYGRIHRFRMPVLGEKWLGLAVADTGNAVVQNGPSSYSIQLRQIGSKGEVLYENPSLLTMELGKKGLSVLSSLPLVEDPNSYIELTAPKPVVVSILYGDPPAMPDGRLNGISPDAFRHKMVLQYRNSSRPDSDVDLTLHHRYLTLVSHIEYNIRTTTIVFLDESQVDAFLALLDASGAASWIPETKESGACDSVFFLHFEMTTPELRNEWQVSSCSLVHAEDRDRMEAFANAMVDLAHDIISTMKHQPSDQKVFGKQR